MGGGGTCLQCVLCNSSNLAIHYKGDENDLGSAEVAQCELY